MTQLSIEVGGIFMSVRDQKDYDVVRRIIDGDLRMEEGAKLAGKSYRQTKRIVKKVREKGMVGIKHGNHGKEPWNKSPVQIKDTVLGLLLEKYFDFNLTHFSEKLEAEHGIKVKRETLRKWAHEKKLVKRAHHRRRPRVHRTRVRMPRRGMLLQMDGSPHEWFGPKVPSCCLVGNIDDATSICEYAEFFPAEDTISVLTVLRRTIERVGIPECLYVDRAPFYGSQSKRTKPIDWDKHLTHIERAMAELGCRILFASSCQAKGRIERMWNTFQDRLIPELRIRNIRRIPTGNYFLHNSFIPEFNQRWSVPAREPKKNYTKVPKHLNFDDIFCLREWRKVDSGETISYSGKIYSVEHGYDYSMQRLQIEIRTRLDGSQLAFHGNRPVTLKRLHFLKTG